MKYLKEAAFWVTLTIVSAFSGYLYPTCSEPVKSTVITLIHDTIYLPQPQQKWIKLNGTVYSPKKMNPLNPPNKTACGLLIDVNRAGKHRYVGLPQWLIRGYTDTTVIHQGDTGSLSYRDTIEVKSNDPHMPYWGLWIVADCGYASNVLNCDFMVNEGDSVGLFKGIFIQKFSKK